MHRYLVERTFPPGSPPLAPAPGGPARPAFLQAHDACGVTWMGSYVTPDQRRSYCIVEGPSPEAVRQAAHASGLPVDRISEVRLLGRNAGPAATTTFPDLPRELP